MAEADAEHRQLRRHDRADRLDRVAAGLRVARAVRQKHAVRFHRQHVRGLGLGRHHGHGAAAIGQHAQDVALHAEVVGHHLETRCGVFAIALAELPGAFMPVIGLLRGHDLGEVHALQSLEGACRGHGGLLVDLAALFDRDDAAVLRALLAQQAREPAGVDAGDADHLLFAQEIRQRHSAAPVAHAPRQVADHESGGVDLAGFHVFGRGAGVADVRIGQGDDLPGVGGIGTGSPGNRSWRY